MIFTDTHSHIYSEDFDIDQNEVVERAINAGVTRVFVPAIDSASFQSMIEVENKYPHNVFLMMGLHPTYVKENYKDELDFVAQKLNERKFCAVGEIGIDLYWDKTFLKEQQYAFEYQIQLAKQYDLPINIHCRDAFDEVLEILEQEKTAGFKGIFHCFTGNMEQAKRAIDSGMKLGIGGVVTFKNGKIDQFLREIDISNIVLETDAPYLAPEPFRGKRNESSYILHIAEKVADIYDLPLAQVAKITTSNSKVIFGF